MCQRVRRFSTRLDSDGRNQKLTRESDYKDDGTNILLDANENAYGPGLALTNDGKLANGDASSIQVDLLGLNRYPDPYATSTNTCDSSMLIDQQPPA